MAKQLKQYTRVSDINVGMLMSQAATAEPTMPMLTYAAEELPVRSPAIIAKLQNTIRYLPAFQP
jgi:hypothetical protein